MEEMKAPVSVDNASMERAVTFAVIEMLGLYAVAVHKGQKGPTTGWNPRGQNPARTAQVLAGLRKNDDNIGGHLHGSLVDVDVDGDGEFLQAALEAFLPICPHVWGRKSRPRTHRLYQLKQEEKTFDQAKFSVLRRLKRIEDVKVEIRGGPASRGEYSLMPGSVHPSGEVYRWDDIRQARAAPAVVEPMVLVNAIRKAGAVTVLAPLWNEGIRQELTMALAGFVHRASAIGKSLAESAFAMSLDEGLLFLEELMKIAGDDPSDARSRRKAFQATWKKADKGIPVTGATTIAELSGDEEIVSKLYILLCDNPGVETIDQFASQFAIWMGPALAVDLEMIERGELRPYMSRRQFANSYGHKFVDFGGGRKLLPEILWSLSSATRVNGLTFDPSDDARIVSDKGKGMINQWIGYSIPPAEKPFDADKFRDYVFRVVCSSSENLYSWVMAWCADLFQCPAKKPGTALVLVGEEGVGKSILGHQILGKIIGQTHYAQANNIENLTRNFNSAYANKILIQCDEAMNSRQRSHAARMKSLITDPMMTVEPKGIDQYFMPNHARIFMTSNDVHDAVHIAAGTRDRRYTVIEVSDCERGRITGYWQPFVNWLGMPETLSGIHRFLKDYEYDKSLIRLPIQTAAKMSMAQSSWNVWDSWLAAMLARGHPLSERVHVKTFDAIINVYDSRHIRRGWPTHVTLTALKRDYMRHLSAQKFQSGPTMNEGQIAARLKQMSLVANSPAKRVRCSEYDERKGAMVSRKIRLYPAPRADRIETYLSNKYGKVPFDEDYEDIGDEADA